MKNGKMNHSTNPTEEKRPRNLARLPGWSAEKFGDLPALTSVDGTSYTYPELSDAARHVAAMLHLYGLGRGDRVAILSENNPHWGITYFGILASGAATVPILPDFRDSEAVNILDHSKARVLFISGKKLETFEETLPSCVELAILMDDFSVLEINNGTMAGAEKAPGKLVKPERIQDQDAQDQALQKLDLPDMEPGDLASIIYTSGTTGRSKGVMLSGENILSNAFHSGSIHKVLPGDRFLSMLPLAHTYECTIGMVVPLLNGARIHYIDRLPTASYLGPILRELKPTTMLTVPLIIEKIYRAKIQPALYGSRMVRQLMKIGPVRKALSRKAAGKLEQFFGGELRFFGIGGAPLAPDVEKFLIEGGFPYAIGYGLTETSPMIAGFGPEAAVYRSVGTVMESVQVRIDQPDPVTGEGEILARGPNVMMGYYKDEETTSQVFTDDGWFRTGDLGYIDPRGIIYIRGRLKNMILGPNGENIYPEEIEAVINSREYVSESLVMQYKGKLVARVHLKMELLEERVQHLKENASDVQHHLQEKAEEVLEELLVQVNRHVARNAQLHRMVLQAHPFEKTPTQKIKRFLYRAL